MTDSEYDWKADADAFLNRPSGPDLAEIVVSFFDGGPIYIECLQCRSNPIDFDGYTLGDLVGLAQRHTCTVVINTNDMPALEEGRT